MNDNLTTLIIEATKFLKVARILLLIWVIAYFIIAILGALGIFSVGGIALYDKMQLPQ